MKMFNKEITNQLIIIRFFNKKVKYYLQKIPAHC